jgi:accessory gene regulator protein AgrB
VENIRRLLSAIESTKLKDGYNIGVNYSTSGNIEIYIYAPSLDCVESLFVYSHYDKQKTDIVVNNMVKMIKDYGTDKL